MGFIATIGAGLLTAKAQQDSGRAQQYQMQAQARTEAVAAKSRELDRRRDLIKALASQNAAAGAGGVEASGSIGGIIRRDIRDASNDLLTENANTTARQRALQNAGRNARAQGDLMATATLFDTAQKLIPKPSG